VEIFVSRRFSRLQGFFKRCITQGTPQRCFFNDRCVINVETRNRCKTCRFRRCVAQGMSMESVKMGRIPKKLKEEALRKRYKSIAHRSIRVEPNEEMDFRLTSTSDDESTSSNHQQVSVQNSPDLMIVPHGSERVDSMTVANDALSFLSLPKIFSQANQFVSAKAIDSTGFASAINHEQMTVATYISEVSQSISTNDLVACEMRFSNNVIAIMRSLAAKLCQPFLIYEFDFQLTSFFRYIRWKMWNFYQQYTVRIQRLIQRMFGLIHLGVSDACGWSIDDHCHSFADCRLSGKQ
jgi:hypothetical protein